MKKGSFPEWSEQVLGLTGGRHYAPEICTAYWRESPGQKGKSTQTGAKPLEKKPFHCSQAGGRTKEPVSGLAVPYHRSRGQALELPEWRVKGPVNRAPAVLTRIRSVFANFAAQWRYAEKVG